VNGGAQTATAGCTACGAGQWSAGAANACTPKQCAAGAGSSNVGSATPTEGCALCSAGQFSTGGSSACAPMSCPPGFSAFKMGSVNATDGCAPTPPSPAPAPAPFPSPAPTITSSPSPLPASTPSPAPTPLPLRCWPGTSLGSSSGLCETESGFLRSPADDGAPFYVPSGQPALLRLPLVASNSSFAVTLAALGGCAALLPAALGDCASLPLEGCVGATARGEGAGFEVALSTFSLPEGVYSVCFRVGGTVAAMRQSSFSLCPCSLWLLLRRAAAWRWPCRL
jgi:hypothetical protein